MIVLYYTYVLHTEWEHAIKKNTDLPGTPKRISYCNRKYHSKEGKEKKTQPKIQRLPRAAVVHGWTAGLERREKRLASKKITHTTYETIFGIRVTPVMNVGQKKMKPRVDRPLFFMTILKS